MPWVSNIVNFFKNQLIYMTGRGLLGFGIATALGSMAAGGLVGGIGFMAIAVTVTAAAQAAVFWRSERRSERQMMGMYRDEVAAKLGIQPAQVSVQHLREVADGNPEKGLEANPVIKDALERNSKHHTMQMVTSAIAGLATFAIAIGVGTLMGMDLGSVDQFKKDTWQTIFPDGSPIREFGNWVNGLLGKEAGNVSFLAAGLTVASSGMGVLNKIFDHVGAKMLHIDGVSSHELIQNISRDIARGHMVSKEQVFGVYVAIDEGLAACVREEFGKDYSSLNQRQQHLAIDQFGRSLPLSKLEYELNHYMIDAEELAFAVVDQESGVPRKRDVNVRELADKEVGVRDIVREVKKEVVGESTAPSPEEEAEADKESAPETGQAQREATTVSTADEAQAATNNTATPETETKAANDNMQGFAARYVPREAMENTQSFAQRYAPNHQPEQGVLSQVERLKARSEHIEQTLHKPVR